MKALLALVVLLAAGLAKADNSVLNCASVGNSLGLVQVNANGTLSIMMGQDESRMVVYRISSGLKSVKTRSSATVIASKAGAESLGDGMDDSILLSISAGQKNAALAMDGVVYTLNCGN